MYKYRIFYYTRGHKRAKEDRPEYYNMCRAGMSDEEIMAEYEEQEWKKFCFFGDFDHSDRCGGLSFLMDIMCGNISEVDGLVTYKVEWWEANGYYYHDAEISSILSPKEFMPFYNYIRHEIHNSRDDSCDKTVAAMQKKSDLFIQMVTDESDCEHEYIKTTETPISHLGRLVAEHRCKHCDDVEYRELKVVLK